MRQFEFRFVFGLVGQTEHFFDDCAVEEHRFDHFAVGGEFLRRDLRNTRRYAAMGIFLRPNRASNSSHS